jgi:hypothetical protein
MRMSALCWYAGVTADLEQVGSRAEDYVRGLVSAIGPRPAGSAAEKQALDWIEGQLNQSGYSFIRQPFRFVRLPAFFPYYTAAGLAFLLAGLFLPGFPWLALIMPLLVTALPDMHAWVCARLPRNAASENLVILPEGCSLAQADLFFCAHIDTARLVSTGSGSGLLNPLRRQVFGVMQRTGLILALIGLVSLMGISFGRGVFAAVITVSGIVALVLIGLDVWVQLGGRGEYAPGANDNASGVGVLLALSQLLAHSSAEPLKVGFVFTAAEEAGLWGAHHFARSLVDTGQSPPVVCVDMVGAGQDLRIIDGAKTLRMVKTSAEINGWLERADPLAVHHTALRRSSDFEAFVRVGIPAGWVESSGTKQSWEAYHTQRDQLDQINVLMLERTATALYRLVERLRRDKGEA